MEEQKKEVLRADLPVSVIDPNPDNANLFNMDDIDILAGAIKRNGFRGAIEVYQKKDGRYEISSGHRRFLAAQQAGLDHIPALIYPMPESEIEKRSLLIDGNIYNREITALDKARAINYQRETLMMAQKKDESISVWVELQKHFNMSRGNISTYLSILTLIPELQQMYAEQVLSVYVVALLTDKSEELQKLIYEGLQKLLSAQKPDPEGKKRLSASQVSIVVERVEADYIKASKEEEPSAIRVPEQYFNGRNVASAPIIKAEPQKIDEMTEGQRAFEEKQRKVFPINATINLEKTRPETHTVTNYHNDETVKNDSDDVEPIDMAFSMLAIQVQKLAASKVKVNDKARMLANIDMMKKALEIIESEI